MDNTPTSPRRPLPRRIAPTSPERTAPAPERTAPAPERSSLLSPKRLNSRNSTTRSRPGVATQLVRDTPPPRQVEVAPSRQDVAPPTSPGRPLPRRLEPAAQSTGRPLPTSPMSPGRPLPPKISRAPAPRAPAPSPEPAPVPKTFTLTLTGITLQDVYLQDPHTVVLTLSN